MTAEPPTPGGGLVRPFIITGGRTTTIRPELRWEALVEASGPPPGSCTSEQLAILSAAAAPISVAELSAQLLLPTVVVAIVVEDLLEAEAVRVHQTDPVEIELSALTRMIERVRSL
jgi:hypothetical protein